MNPDASCLFVIATPVGNLKDITFRAVECLERVVLVAAEDTRRTRNLLTHLGIRKPLVSCNEHNELKKTSRIISALRERGDVALVSDAGTPGLSDPGARLVDQVRQAGLHVIPIPGPSAPACALSVSGFPGRSFYFAGFMPSRSAERIRHLEKLAGLETVLIFFEAPHRLLESLADMLSILGDRRIFFAREMTKSHETYLTTTISRLLERLEGKRIIGEITLVVQGGPGQAGTALDRQALEEILTCLLTTRRVSVKRASKILSALTGTGRKGIYQLALEIGKGAAETG